MTVRTRFAPSPTGYLHVGGARTALFSWLYAKKHQGDFILRIEDTDLERSTEESVQAIFDGMQWLGLDHDEGPFYQTKRFDRYKALIQQLLDEGKAYYCYCSKEELDALREKQMKNGEKPRYDGRYRDFDGAPPEDVPPVVRFKNPQEGAVVINDAVKGTVTVSNSELDDLIIARSDGSPTYNFTVVVDDLDMGVTHCIRGDDHLNNTPRQINILKALGAEPPIYAHVPMILGSDGKRLSKRHGAVSVMQYHEDGYLPEALLNYLVRLGWSHGDQELFTVDEMIEHFDLSGINKAASTFNPDKLLWMNQQYIMNLPIEQIAVAVKPFMEKLDVAGCDAENFNQVLEAQRERAKTLIELAEICAFYYQEFDGYPEKPAKKQLKPETVAVFEALSNKLNSLSDWTRESIHAVIMAVVEEQELKMGQVGGPFRLAVTGGTPAPDLDLTIALVGKEKTLQRLAKAIEWINAKYNG